MARRMFTSDVIAENEFLSLPNRAKILYIYLSLFADDDGLCGCGKMLIPILRAEASDFLALEKAGFIYLFESGVVYIWDFHKMNRIPRGYYTPTVYAEELAAIRRGDVLRRGRLF